MTRRLDPSATEGGPQVADSTFLERLLDRAIASELSGPLPEDPIPTLQTWFEDAASSGAYADPNAMTLATATRDGMPSARIVLCKQIDSSPPALVFFTSYQSRKGRELESNPHAAAVFYWPHAKRQARVEGTVVRTGVEESDQYFESRPLLSRLGAVASRQSQPIASRAELLRDITAAGLNSVFSGVRRPATWGGYRLLARTVELWTGREGRLHDRAVWRQADKDPSRWTVQRLSP